MGHRFEDISFFRSAANLTSLGEGGGGVNPV